MATLTRGYSFGSTEQVTNSKLHSLVDSATVTAIVNADIDAAAAIAYSKLSIGAAAINYSKLNLTGTIVNADVSPSAGIVGSKLDLSAPGVIGATTPAAATFSTLKVGTTNQGDIFYDNGTTIVRLPPGTSGQLLKTQGASANPIWVDNTAFSNVLFQYQAIVETLGGELTPTSLNQNSSTGNYRYLVNSDGSGDHYLFATKFKKFAGVGTITVNAQIWRRTADGAQAKFIAYVGAVTGTVSGTVSQITPEWVSVALDVSGLSNGTVYDVKCGLNADGSSGVKYLGSVIAFGS